ncbi:hypothetical protein ACLUXJ_03415 [Lactobacillus porci]|uniref:hypothetical protein n=1 Tax=Lactobacillus porci TaxID=2012477 RepID=UPI003992BCC4
MKITAAVVEHKGGKFHMRDDIELCKLGATDVRVHEKVGAAVSNFKPGGHVVMSLAPVGIRPQGRRGPLE